jgi:outer membrane receptor protein involved in Fe transport
MGCADRAADDPFRRAGRRAGLVLAALAAMGGASGGLGEAAAWPGAHDSGALAGEERAQEAVAGGEPGAVGEPAEAAPPDFDEAITVTATRTEERLGETAASVTVLGRQELETTAAVTLDDALRQVPGFTLFRRTGSRTANPTTQGASLRGVGGSAASRALVLADGVPINDPFGGWVPWGRVPRAALERVEVLRGGASDLYGSSALAGVVHLVRREPSRPAARGELFAGSQGTVGASLWLARQLGPGGWHAAVAGELFETEGYVPVPPSYRGAVDAPAGTRHGSLELTLGRRQASGTAFLRAAVFEEERANGTHLQENDTSLLEIALGGDWRLGPGSLTLRAWGADQRYRQSFTAVAADRSAESVTRLQDVPADSLGLSTTWVRAPANSGAVATHTLVGGLELRQLRGVSEEVLFLPTAQVPLSAGGGQALAALFVEDLIRWGPRLSLTAALRYDRWRQHRGHLGPVAAPEEAPARADSALSPRLAVRWQASPEWAVTAAAYRSFRAPTLNELYRGFRVGSVVTEPNPELTAEWLWGVESGLAWGAGDAARRWRLRGTAFWLELEDAVANVTVEVTPDLIRRQRMNLGRSRSRGLELEATAELGASWRLSGAYLFADSRVTSFAADPTLVGRRVPQVPEHQASAQVRWLAAAGAWAALQGRWVGAQYDDDRNLFLLEEAFLVDLQVAHPLRGRLELFAAAENLFDRELVAGRTPVPTLGSPRLLRAGLRWTAAGGREAGAW